MLAIKNFTIEYQSSILGVDEKKPRFCWALSSDNYNVFQHTYRIRLVTENEETVWDSGEKHSEASLQVEYNGVSLQPRTRYHAELFVCDNYGEEANASLDFETGRMGGNFSR